MHQNNTYFCDKFLRAVCFQMKRAKKILEEIENGGYKRVLQGLRKSETL